MDAAAGYRGSAHGQTCRRRDGRLGLAIAVGACANAGPVAPSSRPMAAAHLPHGPFTVYVLNQGSGTATPISTATNKAGKPIKVGHSPCSMAIAPDGREVYVTNQMAGTGHPSRSMTSGPTRAKSVTPAR